ncbi:MAG TPA: autotransporter-associated beta strand repeat-containing protein [bacterium]|nr:autotransporter-associated beta strand repeat-containing protein [bacterium]
MGQYSVGTFTANATTQSFTVTTTAGNNDVQLNAIQVRDITVIKAASGTDLTAGASWTGSVAPASGNIATWTGTSLGTGLTIGSSISWLGISAPSAVSDIAITGSGVLTLGTSGIDMSAAANNLSAGNSITLGASQPWIVNSGKTLTASGTVNGVQAGRLLTKSGSGTLTFSGTTDNNSLRAQVSAGAMVLGKTSSSSVHSVGSAGGTDYALTVAGGTAQLGGSGGDQIYDGSAINMTAGTFDLNGQSETFDGLAGTGGNILNNSSSTSSTLTLGANNSSGSPAFSGVIANGSGSVALTKTGTGTQTLSGANTYSGLTLVQSGILAVASGGSSGGLANSGIVVTNGAELDLNASDALGYGNANALTIYGTVNKINNQSETLFRPITLSGGTISNTLTSANEAYNLFGNYIQTAAGTTNLITGAGKFGLRTATCYFNLGLGSQLTIASGIQGNVSTCPLNLLGAGTLVLSAVNTYAGATVISAGTLTVGGTGQLNSGSYAGNITNNGSFVYNSSAAQTLSGVISGSGTVKQAGSGALTLSGANTYTGATIVNHNSSVQIPPGSSAGALVLNNTISSTTVTIGNYSTGVASGNAALQLGVDNPLPSNATLTFDGNNGGPYAYLKLMGKKLTVASLSVVANDNSGTTSAVICNDGGDGTSAQIGILTVSNSTSVTYPGRIRDSVNGATTTGYVELIKDGSGTLFLTGPYNSPAVFTKGTVIKAGTLDISGSSGTGFSANAPITNSGGIFNLGALNLASVTALQLAGGGTINGTGSINNNTASYDLQSGTINPALNGSVGINKSTTGTVTLAGINGFSGAVALNAGTLALSGSGSISNASSLNIAAGATFDMSALSSSTFNLSGSTSLSASGAGIAVGSTAATIKGASGGTVNLGSRPITLTYDGSHPALYISQGTLSLTGNAFTVNTQSPLPVGTYAVIQQAGGNVVSSGTFTVTGTAIAFGTSAAINVNGGNVTLVVSTKTNSLAIFGTSVAKGYGSSGANNNLLISGGSYSNSWAALLTTNLLAKTYVVTNDSVPGDTSSGGAARFGTTATPQSPHYVLIAYSLGNDNLGGSINPVATVSTYLANVTNMMSQCFSNGFYPVVGLCYARNDIQNASRYSLMQGANLAINSWNVPSINLDGVLNNNSGGLISGVNSGDGIHPNDYGHAEIYYSIPPSLFEALSQGRTNRPYLSSATNYARLVQTAGVTSPVVFTPTNTMHSFTMSFRVRGTSSGTLATVRTGGNYAILQITNGQFVYVSPGGSSITAGSINATNGDWHDVALSFRYALTNTWFFLDGTQAGSLTEQYVPDQFILGGPGASGAPATPAVVDFQNWCVYRSAWNLLEARAQSQGSLQQASLEIGAMLDESSFVSNSPAISRAQSLSVAMMNTPALTAMQSVVPPSNLNAHSLSLTSVILAWTTNSGNSLVIERRLTGATAWTYLTTVAAGTTNFTDGGLTTGAAYDYRVAALDGTLQGNYSKIATVTPGLGVHQTMLIDFGPNDVNNGNVTTSPDWLGQYWNNLVGTQLGGSINPALGLANLTTTTNGTTSIGLTTSATGWSANGIQNGGLITPSYSLLGNFAVTNATEDYFFTESSASLAVTNLDPSLNYRVRVFGSRNSADVRIGKYVVTGGNGAATNYLQSSGAAWTNNGAVYNGNNNTIISFSGIVPDGGNQIQMTVTTNSPSAFAYVEIMEIAANHSPVVNTNSYGRNGLTRWKISISDLLTNAIDEDFDPLTLVGVGTSTNGMTLLVGGGYVIYSNTNLVDDRFSYTVTDGFGATNTSTITLTAAVPNGVGGQVSGAVFTNGVVSMTFAGIPGYRYHVQVSTNLSNWSDVLITNAPAGGLFQFDDTMAPQPSAYYRLMWSGN